MNWAHVSQVLIRMALPLFCAVLSCAETADTAADAGVLLDSEPQQDSVGQADSAEDVLDAAVLSDGSDHFDGEVDAAEVDTNPFEDAQTELPRFDVTPDAGDSSADAPDPPTDTADADATDVQDDVIDSDVSDAPVDADSDATAGKQGNCPVELPIEAVEEPEGFAPMMEEYCWPELNLDCVTAADCRMICPPPDFGWCMAASIAEPHAVVPTIHYPPSSMPDICDWSAASTSDGNFCWPTEIQCVGCRCVGLHYVTKRGSNPCEHPGSALDTPPWIEATIDAP